MGKNIRVRGAKMHNLQNLDVEIPRDGLTVVTGVSGSGKSSLAFDTIYAEGQRRYVESLSTYARQFLQLQEKPEVDSIEGLSPAISIDQKTAPRNPRSTVGTVTEIYDYLRLLFAKIGVPKNPENGRILAKMTPGQMVEKINHWPENEKFMILSPVVRGKKGEHLSQLEKIAKAGFVRMRIDGEIRTIAEEIELDPKKKHTIEIVVDRLEKKDFGKKITKLPSGESFEEKNDDRLRLLDSIETALKFGDGILIVHRPDSDADEIFSEHLSDPETGFSFPPIEPRLFSFNSPHGACESCHGLGYRLEIDPETALARNLSIREGAFLPWSSLGANAQSWNISVVEAIGEKYNFSLDVPLKNLDGEILEKLLNGFFDPAAGGKKELEKFAVKLRGAFAGRTASGTFEGLIAQSEKRYNETESEFVRKKLSEFMTEKPCADCGGARLNVFGRNVFVPSTFKEDGEKDKKGQKKLSEHSLPQITQMPIPKVRDWVGSIEKTPETAEIVRPIQKEISDRLGFLENVGLGYLNLSRAANTLSGGEAQRIRLATQIGSQLQGVLYVLDEPSIGLHQRDNDRLIATLKSLRDGGNTVIVVEHDEDTMRAADHLIEIGPGAGAAGGTLVFSGDLKSLEKQKCETGDFLFGRQKIAVPSVRRRAVGFLEIVGAQENNLKDVSAKIPLGCLVGVSGVSGSGKSSLINRVLVPALAKSLNRAKKIPGAHKSISGIENLDKLISITQSAIGRTPRSNPATYTGIFGDIREIFAGTPEARVRGYGIGRFSFNVKGGRCEACGGDGIKKIEMHFLPDVFVPCEMCGGKRYNDETLEVTYRGKSIAQVLEMSVDEAEKFFQNFPKVAEKLAALSEVGLGYIHLGQSATTLSGGEAQRVKLATELMRRATGRTIYVLDEPTTGLHFSDVKKLLNVLQKLVDKGNSVLVIEHHLDVLKSCDFLLDLGPEGGSGGGEIIATGTPEEVAKNKDSFTGKFLKRLL